EEDILVGRFDDASVEHWWVNWQAPEDRILVLRGALGEVRQQGNAFEAELRGISEALNRPLGRAFSRTCGAAFGDSSCGIDPLDPAYSAEDTVTTALDGAVVVARGLDAFAEGWFSFGVLDWQSGSNQGLRAMIKQDLRIAGTRRLELWETPPLPPALGDRFRVTAGCDGTAATCRVKFDNFLNFRGFPHIPGEDWVTAYPRSGDVHEGGTRGGGANGDTC
ncbi:MAG: phage BR0599 family protein, partial [Pseudomonadota bacterium]